MGIYNISLANIDDSADPGKTIMSYLETNLAAILGQNTSGQQPAVNIARKQ